MKQHFHQNNKQIYIQDKSLKVPASDFSLSRLAYFYGIRHQIYNKYFIKMLQYETVETTLTVDN